MSDFKREDYVYLRYLKDDKENYRKKGDILRYRKGWLLEEMLGRNFHNCFCMGQIEFKRKQNIPEDEVRFDKVYESMTVTEDISPTIYLLEDDILYLDEWFLSHLDSEGKRLISSIDKSLPSSENNKLIKLNEGLPQIDSKAEMHFKAGEKIDFSLPGVMALFYNNSWIKLLTKTEFITGEEKEKIFNEDFKNAICEYAIDDSSSFLFGKQELHYFKIKENIKIKTNDELTELLGAPYFSASLSVIRDEEGYITYICTKTTKNHSSNREMEQDILKIAERISIEEAKEVHKKACIDYQKKQEEERRQLFAKIEEEVKKLDESYQKLKNDPEKFPGVNGEFVHINKNIDEKRQKYSLEEIKEFYKKLKSLNPEIVKHMCFYGGTIPYIVNDAESSREFGDIDIFMPIEYMEKLRKELEKEASFEMICDSKPYAEECMLTTRIPKKNHPCSIAKKISDEQSMNETIVSLLYHFMIPRELKKDYIDEKGIVHSPLNVHQEEQLPYYRKVQDFGFKAKLFGVNISVFPLYEYEDDIMAKSFNINDMYKFLLGVKVIENTKIKNFVKSVKVYGTVFNILPMEYTLVSKKSAVDEEYSFRLDKDKEDIAYILSHKEELEISDEELENILRNYPDYSVSIAYLVDGDSTVTMNGETYKELILTNRQLT